MAPTLALVFCTVFVLILLQLERRVSRGVSAALWVPILWILAISTKPLAIWFGLSGDNESGSELDRLVLSALGVLAVAVLAHRRFDWFGALRRHGWLLALLAYMLASTLWSDIPLIAFRRWMREIITLVMALVMMSEADPRQALRSLLRRSVYILIPFSLALIKYYPVLGRAYGRWSGAGMWVGVTVQKNSLGRLCLIAAFFLLWALYCCRREPEKAGGRRHRWADLSVLVLALYLLKGAEDSYSATSLGALAAGTIIFVGLVWLRKLKLQVPQSILLALLIFLIGFGTATPFLGGSNVASFTSALGRDDTLTGRTEVWAALVPVVKRQPLFGSGFGSFWTTERRVEYQISHSHNGYLDSLLELGAVGLALNTFWLLSCARKLRAALAEDYDGASLGICFLLIALICNFTESILTSFTEPMTALLTLTSFVALYKPVLASRQTESCPASADYAAPGLVSYSRSYNVAVRAHIVNKTRTDNLTQNRRHSRGRTELAKMGGKKRYYSDR
jgi:exopolysaccharide production protein ExoQ